MTKLVFLHGSGDNKEAYAWLFREAARMFGAGFFSFNAPLISEIKPNGYKWFNKFDNNGRRDAVIKDYNASLSYIKKQLKKIEKNTSDIILAGHSQGGGLAVHIGLEEELKGVISINGDLPYNLIYQKKTKTPIYWLESAEDTYLNDERKKSYELIVDNNHFHRFVLPDSTHQDFENDFLNFLKLGVMEF